MSQTNRVGGGALIVFALVYFGSFALASPLVGLEDPDNLATTLAFMQQSGGFYFLAGLCSVLAALALVAATLAVADHVLQQPSAMLARATTALGLIAAAFFLLLGVLRMNSPGTLVYMEEMEQGWGLAAYAAVQMVGTQGLFAAGALALSLWAIGLSVAGWRARTLSRDAVLLGFLPALPWVLGLLGHYGLMPDGLWLVYIGALVLGIPLWAVAMGIALLRPRTEPQPTLSTPEAS